MQSEEKIYIRSFSVLNVGGIEKFSAEIGQVAIITGCNAAGKTSLRDALQSVFEGGHDPWLIRRMDLDGDGILETACDEARVDIVLSNAVTITKTITLAESVLDIRSADGGTVRGPATYLKSLLPPNSFDPIAFLQSDPKDRAAFLLKALPVVFEPEEVNAALDGRKPGAAPVKVVAMTERARKAVSTPIIPIVVTERIGLQKLNELRQGRYDERTICNRQKRDLEGTIRDMQSKLPADDKVDWRSKAEDLQQVLGSKDSQIATLEADLDLQAEQAKKAARIECQQDVQVLDGEITELENQILEKRHARRSRLEKLESANARIDSILANQKASDTKILQEEKNAIAGELAEARAKVTVLDGTNAVRKVIEDSTKKLEGSGALEMRLTRVVEAIDALKLQKIKALPIEGLDIRTNGRGTPEILIGGLPIEKLNGQAQLYIAFRALRLVSGQLPLMFCECNVLDETHMQQVCEAVKQSESGAQMIIERWVDQAPLAVIEG